MKKAELEAQNRELHYTIDTLLRSVNKYQRRQQRNAAKKIDTLRRELEARDQIIERLLDRIAILELDGGTRP